MDRKTIDRYMTLARALIIASILSFVVSALIIVSYNRYAARHPHVRACIEYDADDPEYSHESTQGLVCESTEVAGNLHVTCCTP